MMTRTDARMIAQELYKLMKQDRMKEEYLDTAGAADFLGVSVSFIRHNIKDIPHTKHGRMTRFQKSALSEYMEKRQPMTL